MSLRKLDFLNRDQLTRIHRLGSVRNANRILKEMSSYITGFREESYSTIYFLNKEGREYVNTDKVRRKNKFVNHYLKRNDFYIYMGCPHDWENEIKVSDGIFTIVADSYFKKDGKYNFLEVDSTQKMSVNKKKIEQYKGLMRNGELAKHLGYFPKLIWLTTTELRRKQLTVLCKGLPYRVYTLNDIK
ncbi:replication-relaxation family protein [Neobacillus cucumis]|uniref:replication-relaxation family protein n=1 Tax=Neobacillus cucumis TaxID=1740721 RepID=UPI00203C273E|nr:replication-relaxation family protein [Neobacillus cucumis]MCM3728703.1 replication-relaxation family protein [Neobacillus cucumis]